MAVTDAWADWSSTAASNGPAGSATPEIDDELRNIKAQVKGNAFTASVGGATQAIQETGTATNVYVTPGVQKYHPSACKAWGTLGVTGNVVESYNVSSINDDGTGLVRVYINTDFSTANYAVTATAHVDTAYIVTVGYTGNSQVVGGFQLICKDSGGTAQDPGRWFFVAFGDQ